MQVSYVVYFMTKNKKKVNVSYGQTYDKENRAKCSLQNPSDGCMDVRCTIFQTFLKIKKMFLLKYLREGAGHEAKPFRTN